MFKLLKLKYVFSLNVFTFAFIKITRVNAPQYTMQQSRYHTSCLYRSCKRLCTTNMVALSQCTYLRFLPNMQKGKKINGNRSILFPGNEIEVDNLEYQLISKLLNDEDGAEGLFKFLPTYLRKAFEISRAIQKSSTIFKQMTH